MGFYNNNKLVVDARLFLTWKEVEKVFGDDQIFFTCKRTPFWKWLDKDVPVYEIAKTSNEIRENFMNCSQWKDFYSKQNLNLHKR